MDLSESRHHLVVKADLHLLFYHFEGVAKTVGAELGHCSAEDVYDMLVDRAAAPEQFLCALVRKKIDTGSWGRYTELRRQPRV